MTRQSRAAIWSGFLLVAILPDLFWIVFSFALVVALAHQVLRVGRAAASLLERVPKAAPAG